MQIALSCGRDCVRWPCRWLAGGHGRPAVEPAALADTPGTAGSLVLRRMDCWGHKRGLVRAKKHGTESGADGLFLNENLMDFVYDCRLLW